MGKCRNNNTARFFLENRNAANLAKNGKWYLYFGGVISSDDINAASIDSTRYFKNGAEYVTNYIYTSSDVCGEYKEQPWSNIRLPDKMPFYICKTIVDPQNRDVMVAHGWGIWKLLQPYLLTYKTSGEIMISK